MSDQISDGPAVVPWSKLQKMEEVDTEAYIVSMNAHVESQRRELAKQAIAMGRLRAALAEISTLTDANGLRVAQLIAREALAGRMPDPNLYAGARR